MPYIVFFSRIYIVHLSVAFKKLPLFLSKSALRGFIPSYKT